VLVLTRRPGESVCVGDDIEVDILEVRPGVVRLGIRAPRDVRVLRAELVAEVAAANTSAASRSSIELSELEHLGAVRPEANPISRRRGA
jgi:carbon storage regulator